MSKPTPNPSDKIFREVTFARSAINADARTVELACSSEEPYERWFGDEILDHNKESIRLGRLENNAPLLLDHDARQVIGVIEGVNLGGDKKLRATVRFGKGPLADEIFNDVVDGIRSKVSIGYFVHKMALEEQSKEHDSYRVTEWEPFEVSIVAIPADDTVGVGRKHEPVNPQMKRTETMEAVKTTESPAAVDVAAIQTKAREDARKAELDRITQLEAIGQKFEKFGGQELARKAINEGQTVDQLNMALLERINTNAKKPTATGEIGLTEKEVRQFSFLRAAHALANPGDPRSREAAAFEFEVSNAAQKESGKVSRGIMIPVDVLRAGATAKRDMTVGSNTGGGFTVATELQAQSFIELLRNKLAIAQMGATVLNGLQGNIAIPRQTGGATAYWVAESGAPTESTSAVDQVTMSPKTVGAYTDVSRKLLLQSSIDVENMVRNDIARVLALEIDRVALYGLGSSNQPQGLKTLSGLNTVNLAAATPTFAELIEMETKVATGNADVATMKYLTNALGRGLLKGAPKVSGQPVYIWEDDMVNGYGAYVSNQVETASSTDPDFWFGNWAELLIGFWSGLDLMVDPYTQATSGTIRLIGLQDTDVACRHAVSFTRAANTL